MSPEREARWSQWMAAAQGGDGRAYEALLRDVLPALREFIRRDLSDGVSAEEAAHAVLRSIHRSRHSYRREQPFEPWLWAIARHALDEFRRRREAKTGAPLPGEDPEGGGGAEPI